MDNTQRHAGPAPIPADHPLRQMFAGLVTQAFHQTLGLADTRLSAYLANLLTEFAHADNLYRLRNAAGAPLKEVVEMLQEADMILQASSFEQERAVHKHIGDFTLFWAGVYPEMLERLQARGTTDGLLDYVRQGKQSYYIVSTFRYGHYAPDAGLFQTLSEEFELCQYGLRLVRREWERLSARAA